MRRLGLRALPLLLLIAIPACAAPTFYHGPVSDHFDGKHFFKPDQSPDLGQMEKETKLEFAECMVLAHRNWPASVPIIPSKPPAQVAAPHMLVTWIGHSTVLIQVSNKWLMASQAGQRLYGVLSATLV